MPDGEDKAKAEKLAAAKKRVAQLQKQKAKGKKSGGAAGSSKANAATKAEVEKQEEDQEEKQEEKQDEGEDDTSAGKQKEVEEEALETSAPEPAEEAPGSPEPDTVPETSSGTTHRRQPSLSVQSKMRSSSFRRSSISQSGNAQNSASLLKSPPLPPLTPDGETMPELFRKQAVRLEELEKENKRLEKEMEDAEGRWKKSEEQLDDLREANGEVVELKDRTERAEKKAAEVEKLKSEITSLQRQNAQLHTKTHRGSSVAVSGTADSSALQTQLDSKTATIEAMELEISNLMAQVNSQSTSSSAHEAQISALEGKLGRSEASLERTQRELADTKHSLTRASEKAVKEGVDKTSSETLVKSLERQVEELNHAKAEADKKTETLEKKLQALGNLHKESESRNQARLRESERVEGEAAILRKKLATTENENLRLREERERARKRDVGHTGDEEGLDELEDEERTRLEKRVRELEGEVFDLTRGVWKEKRQELGGEHDSAHPDYVRDPDANFDDVDLIGGAPGADHSRRRSMAAIKSQRQQQQHSSFSTVLSSGFAAFTGAAGGETRQPYHPAPGPKQGRGSLDFLSEEVESLNDDEEFDEEAFALAQAEEEAKKRVEWVREVKKKLKDWQGWRLDLVDSRAGAEGVLGVGMGEIFEV